MDRQHDRAFDAHQQPNHGLRLREHPSDTHQHGKKHANQNSRDYFLWSLTPELTGAGARSAQGTNIGHQNREAMANVGVRVERFVRLRRVGRVWQVHSKYVRFECPQQSGERIKRLAKTTHRICPSVSHYWVFFGREDAISARPEMDSTINTGMPNSEYQAYMP
jgi:hypothetical protein